jgi:hypothetical protein
MKKRCFGFKNILECKLADADITEAAILFRKMDMENLKFDYDIRMFKLPPVYADNLEENASPMVMLHQIHQSLLQTIAKDEDLTYSSVLMALFELKVPDVTHYIANIGTLIMYPVSISFLIPMFLSNVIHEKSSGLMSMIQLVCLILLLIHITVWCK